MYRQVFTLFSNCSTSFPTLTALLTLCSAIAGCGSADPSPAKIATEESAAEVILQDTRQLEEAGAHVVRDAQGTVTEVSFRDVAATDALATSTAQLEKLNKLVVVQSSMTDAGWQELGKLTGLQQLDLRGCPLTNAQLQAVAANQTELRALRLSGKSGATQVDDAGLDWLANLTDLKALALDDLWVSSASLEHLADHPRLAELYLANTLVDDQALDIIASLPALRKLRLAQTSIGATGLERLSDLPIEDLDISECSQVFDNAMPAVGQLTTLKRLNLWRVAITDDGVRALSGLSELRWLNLDNTQISDAGLASLQPLKQLEFLHLGSTGVSDAGMPQLVELSSLKDLKVTRTAVTEAGVQTVTDSNPDVQVQLKYVAGQ